MNKFWCQKVDFEGFGKGGLITEGILTLVPLPTKGAKSLPWAEILNKLFTVIGKKFIFSAQGSGFAPFVGNLLNQSQNTFWD